MRRFRAPIQTAAAPCREASARRRPSLAQRTTSNSRATGRLTLARVTMQQPSDRDGGQPEVVPGGCRRGRRGDRIHADGVAGRPAIWADDRPHSVGWITIVFVKGEGRCRAAWPDDGCCAIRSNGSQRWRLSHRCWGRGGPVRALSLGAVAGALALAPLGLLSALAPLAAAAGDGSLTRLKGTAGCLSVEGYRGQAGCTRVRGLGEPRRVAASPDGHSVYVTSAPSVRTKVAAVAIFQSQQPHGCTAPAAWPRWLSEPPGQGWLRAHTWASLRSRGRRGERRRAQCLCPGLPRGSPCSGAATARALCASCAGATGASATGPAPAQGRHSRPTAAVPLVGAAGSVALSRSRPTSR